MLKNPFIASFTALILVYGSASQAEDVAGTEISEQGNVVITNSKPANIKVLNETSDTNIVPSDAIIIDGDKLELQLDRKMRSIGNAAIHRGKQDAYGDIIEYDVQNDELHIIGNARIQVGNAKLSGPELRMRLSESIGEMRDASISITKSAESRLQQSRTISSETFSRQLGNLQSQQIGSEGLSSNMQTSNVQSGVMFGANTTEDHDSQSVSSVPQASSARGDAKAIFFEGPNKKRLIGARYTTCAAGVDDWYIKASEIELNDYSDSGTAKNAYIEFKGVPLLYTPWISFSFNDQRKSGLLAPTIGSTSRSGFEVAAPYYWNISPNKDATFAVRALSKRGVQLQGEFRYLEENFSGIDNLEYLPSDNLSNQTRYYANLKHNHYLGNGWSAGFSLEKVSDNQYFSELSTRIVTTSRINLPQQFNVDYADDTWRFNALAQKFQTLDKLSYPYERLPQMTLVGNKYYGDLNTNLYTQMSVFDTDPNDPVTRPTGTRIVAYPSVSLPFTRPYGYITPKFGIHHTSYNLSNVARNLESQQRTVPIFSLDSGLYFDRDFKIANRDYSQTIEPRLYYVRIPDRRQATIPIFDTSESDLNFSSLFSENQFTGNDRVNNANQLSFGLTTRFIESSSGTDRLSASIGQRYYFSDQKDITDNYRISNKSDIIAGISGHLKNSWVISAFGQYNTSDSKAVRSTLTGRYNPEPGKALNLSYSYRSALINDVNSGINQTDISGQWPLGKGWYGIGRANYSFKERQTIETLAGLEYDAGCWQARGVIQRVSTATADTNTALFFQLELGGLASIGANPLAIIKRNIPGYVSSGLIPDTYQQPYYE